LGNYLFASEYKYELHEQKDGRGRCLKVVKEGYQDTIRKDCEINEAKFIPYRQFIIYNANNKKKSKFCMETIQGRANVAFQKVEMKKCNDFQKEYPNLKHFRD
jgi:hypothetical protein